MHDPLNKPLPDAEPEAVAAPEPAAAAPGPTGTGGGNGGGPHPAEKRAQTLEAEVSALKDQGITELVVPWSNLIVFLILAGLLGLVAASWPARRAARLNVLDAIATE